MELILRNLQHKNAVEEAFEHKKMEESKYREFKKFEADADVFINMMIQFYNERIKDRQQVMRISTDSPQHEKVRFLAALVHTQRPSGQQNQKILD